MDTAKVQMHMHPWLERTEGMKKGKNGTERAVQSREWKGIDLGKLGGKGTCFSFAAGPKV